MKYEIKKKEEETECSYCAVPLYVGDRVFYWEEIPYCSEVCAKSHNAMQAQKEREKILIRTGSAPGNKTHNKKQFRLLNAWLFSEANPHQELFEREILCLDDTDGFVAVIPSSKYGLGEKSLAEVARKIASVVRFDNKSYIYVDHFILEVQ